METQFNIKDNCLWILWNIIDFKSIKDEYINSDKFSVPLFPKIFWTMKFYPLIQNVEGNNIGLVVCVDGNLFAKYRWKLHLNPRPKSSNTDQSAQYFRSDNSESIMHIINHFEISQNSISIICTITIPFNSYIGDECLKAFEHSLRVLNDQKHCDFIIKVQDKCFNVHKCILSTHWPHFATLINSESGTLAIQDEASDVIEAMIRYIYTGTSNVTDLNLALKLITLSDKYDLPELKTKSLKFRIAKMNKHHVIKSLLKAKLYKLDDLFQACVNFLKSDQTIINTLPDYDLLVASDNGFELLAFCFDNVRGIKRSLDSLK